MAAAPSRAGHIFTDTMMNGMTRLHAIAAMRGDGLRPELLALFEQRQQVSLQPNVIELKPHNRDCAGPGPLGADLAALPDSVLAFPAPSSTILRHASKRQL